MIRTDALVQIIGLANQENEKQHTTIFYLKPNQS